MRSLLFVVASLLDGARALIPSATTRRGDALVPPASSRAIAVERLKALKAAGGLPGAVAAEKLTRRSRVSAVTLMAADEWPSVEVGIVHVPSNASAFATSVAQLEVERDAWRGGAVSARSRGWNGRRRGLT